MSGRYRYPQFRHTSDDVNIVEHIKWCRNNLGERGRDWDFSGSGRKVEIWVREGSAKYTFYQMKYGNLPER